MYFHNLLIVELFLQVDKNAEFFWQFTKAISFSKWIMTKQDSIYLGLYFINSRVS